MTRKIFHKARSHRKGDNGVSEQVLYQDQLENILSDFAGNQKSWNAFKEYAETHRDGSYWTNLDPEYGFGPELIDIINKNLPDGDGCYGNLFYYDVIAEMLRRMNIKDLWKIGKSND